MTMLANLAAAAGLLPAYHDIAGGLHVAPPATQRALLAHLGFAADTEAAAEESLLTLQRQQRSLLPPVVVWRQPHGRIPLYIPAQLESVTLKWRFLPETGETAEGHATVTPMSAIVDGSAGQVCAAQLDFAGLDLAEPWPLGYHTLEVDCGGQSGRCALIIAPPTAYCPQWQCNGERLWGVTSHIYTLRSEHDWGIGDTTALRELLLAVAGSGGDVVAINPLHALFPDQPAQASPYWPSSRLFLNPLYLDFEAVPELAGAQSFAAQINAPEFRDRIARLRDQPLINYEAVASLKQTAFDAAMPAIADLPELATFTRHGGIALERFATFCALSQSMKGRPWPTWPEELRHPDNPAVAQWARDHAPDVRHRVAIQWLIDREIASAASSAATMKIGLMRDLAVGVSPDGADAWAEQDTLALGVRIGAPPDDFATGGQDWGLPPFNPLALRDQGYRPFIAAMRANMAHAGGLRIDHVMGLRQQFWIPPGAGAANGAYMRFPLDDMLGILALESERHRCLIVGEDLGTVPDGLRERLDAENVFSTRIFRFERYPDGLFKRPELYPAKCMAQADTHDLPTLAGYWTGADLELRLTLGDHTAATEMRTQERELVEAALRDQHMLGANGAVASTYSIIGGIHSFLARSASQLVTVSLEDVLALTRQLNVPGTTTEYPNWRARVPMTVDELIQTPQWVETVAMLRRLRGVHGTRLEHETELFGENLTAFLHSRFSLADYPSHVGSPGRPTMPLA